ncbi:RNA-binding protein [Candidatus Dojkabacteria bacterium]|uniref:RNA-binding protein n=1 Tax=Candidatus Dojkabacteria bacterium TaxID=2099670 RepID=A0A955HZS1_9BACT|nr:RNA-binding protein [Candidatus Dojkabacteria bacterium]
MKNKLFVGNLSWDTTEDSLRAMFEQIGEVQEVVIIMDRRTNRSKGFGFVTFVNAEDAARAVEELNGKELDGREINVSEARDPKPRE